jgi:hypothetical protein
MPAVSTSYSEAAYFDGAPVAHCAAREDNARLRRIASRLGQAPRPSRQRLERAL